MKSRKMMIFAYVFLFISLAIYTNIDLGKLYSLPNNFVASYSDVEIANQHNTFGSFIKADLAKKNVSTQKENERTITFKLFGFIPIKKIQVKILPEEEVYLGGVPIGLSLTASGAIVISDTTVSTVDGQLVTNKNEYLKPGDIIQSIDGKKVETLDEIENLLSESADKSVTVEFIRKNQTTSQAIPIIKNDDGKNKLGIWVKDDVSGVGTLTFVNKKEGKFAALGHPVTDGQSGNVVPISGGKIFTCSLIGISKGERNEPGELRCVFLQSNEKGIIEKNNKYGIFGHMENYDELIDANLTAKIGGRLGVSPGKAKIISSVSGIREEYEIEIIKASYQTKSDDKSMVFRVKDKRLLELTGGIVQGMSGSPIIQNGKLVGAVTHVFLSDPTKGYGVYTDWMLANS